MSKSGGVLKSAAYKLSEKNIGNKFRPQNGGARSHFVLKCGIKLNFQNSFTFCKLTVSIIKFGVGIFSDRSWMFVCSIRSILCKHLRVHNRNRGQYKLLKGQKMECWQNLGLSKKQLTPSQNHVFGKAAT